MALENPTQAAQLGALIKKKHKYSAHKTEVNGIMFASKREAERYKTLLLLEKAGEISGLTLQRKLEIKVHDIHICVYIADFVYLKKGQRLPTYEDVKGVKTPAYQLKKKLVKAIYDIDIVEV